MEPGVEGDATSNVSVNSNQGHVVPRRGTVKDNAEGAVTVG
jgi:hypothetical protein